jgi:hypothetical protein
MYTSTHQIIETFLYVIIASLLCIKVIVWWLYQHPKYKFKDLFYFNDLKILKSKSLLSERLKKYQNAMSYVIIAIVLYLIVMLVFLNYKIPLR